MRELPGDINAERMTLGSCLLDRDAILAARHVVAVEDFFIPRHALIYAAILDCVDQRVPPDIGTVSSQLQKDGKLDEIGGLAFLTELSAEVPSAVHVEYYAKSVADTAARRRLIEMTGQIQGAAYVKDAEAVLNELQQRLQLERRIVTGVKWKGQAIDGHDIWNRTYPPPVYTIEKILPAGTFLLTGKSKTRKSWMALNFAYAVAAGGTALGAFQALKGDVLYVDLEMGERRINRRLKVLFPDEPPPKGVQFVEEWPMVGRGFEDELESYLQSHPYTRLVVVDTMVAIRPPRDRSSEPYEQDKAFAQQLTDFCHGKDITLLLIHHSRKMAGTDVVDDASGTMGLSGGVDNVGSLSRTEEKDGGLLRLVGRDIELDDDLDLKWDGQFAQWNYQPNTTDMLSPERMLIIKILEASPGLYPKQIAERLRKPEHSIRRLLQSMKKDRQVDNAAGQYYAVDMETAASA